MRIAFVPRTTEFYDLFTRAGENMLETARLVERRFAEFPADTVRQSEVKALESKGDDLTREILELLNTQYVTPFDREDIYELAKSIDDASAYFQPGSVGYSETRQGTTLDGLRLATARWAVEPLAIDDVAATFFDDRSRFPEGSIAFDHGLLMTHIAHEWYGVPPVLLSASRAPDRSLRPS